jgi:hypothetical protein
MRRQDKLKSRRDSISGLNFKTCAGFRKITDRAWDLVAPEKNFPRFECPHTRSFSMIIHGFCGSRAVRYRGQKSRLVFNGLGLLAGEPVLHRRENWLAVARIRQNSDPNYNASLSIASGIRWFHVSF